MKHMHRGDVDRLKVWRKEEGRGLTSIDTSIQQLEDCIEKHEGGLITDIRNDTDNKKANRMTLTRKHKCEEQLYGRLNDK